MKKTETTQATFESIWATLDRITEQREQFEAQHAKDIAEAEEQRKKAAAEADVRMKRIEDVIFGTAQKGVDKEFEKQQTKSYAEINKILDKVAKEVGGISNNNGHSAEEYFFNALDATRKLGNIKFDFIERNRERHIGKVQDEFDIIMFNGSSVAIIEVKYRAREHSLQNLTTKKVQNFRTLYPEYADRKLYLGIASMSFNEEVLKEAKKLGIGVLKQKGDTIECYAENIKAY
ncbi:hypothetical protein FACS1894199_12390 [Bacteroidia bacterium]|nr:hypothetical protein FACS1894199_12390 [Bacteroidia bacterium]